MANPSGVVLTNLTFGGNDVYEDSLGCRIWIMSGLFDAVEVRGRDDTLLGVDGLFQRNRKPSRRRIELAGFVAGSGADQTAQLADFYTRRTNLESWFAPTVRRTLLATLSDGRTASIVALTLPPGVLANEPVPGAAEVTISLESIVPNWTWTPAP
jgi:hypothetical protein